MERDVCDLGPSEALPCRRASSRDRTRYSGINQAIHWITAALIAAVIVLGWVVDPRHITPRVLSLWEWHKTIGIVVLLMTVGRIGWRFIDPPPSPPAYQSRWDHLASRATYLALFAALLWFPVTGYVYSSAAGAPPKLFNLIPTPVMISRNPELKEVAKAAHLGSLWLIYVLVLLHIAGVIYHVAIRRDRMLDRMLPEPQDSSADGERA